MRLDYDTALMGFIKARTMVWFLFRKNKNQIDQNPPLKGNGGKETFSKLESPSPHAHGCLCDSSLKHGEDAHYEELEVSLVSKVICKLAGIF